ncbi:unnamed protein product [Caenorhabditis brenneri]
MCGNQELESSDYSSDEDTDSVESFHSVGEEKATRNWAYTIFFCYAVTALTFIGLFFVWFFSKGADASKLEKEE